MKEQILNHLVTIFLNSSNEELDGMMFCEDENIKRHKSAIKNIETKMNKLRVPYISSHHTEEMDIIFDHACYGNIIITNFKADIPMVFIYLPETLDKRLHDRVSYIIKELNDIEIHLFKLKGELFYTEHKDEYVKNKELSLTSHLQPKEKS